MTVPIRIRLTLVYSAVFFLSTVLLEAAAYLFLTSAIHAIVDNTLETRLNGVEEFLAEHAGRLPLPRLQADLAVHAALHPQLLAILDASGQILHQGSFLVGFRGGPALAATTLQTFEGGAKPLRILSTRRTIKRATYSLFLAEDLTVPFAMLRRFRLLIFLSPPIVLACASLAGYWIAKRALLPVSQLTTAARYIGAANLSQRLAEPGSGDELQALARTLNGMLGRIEDAFGHVTQFTANASHELRTPLALIRTTSEVALLRVNGDAATYREALHRILRETEKNTILLDDLLRLARADSAARVLSLRPLALSSHLEQVCEQIVPLAREKNLRLTWEPGGFDNWVAADAAHLRRLWLILLDNAIKYTPSGGAIQVISRASPDSCVACEIRDSGIGIAAADLPHIFERFYRADKARSREEAGSGLGLSIARWIVDAHRATIHVESAPGAGSVFRVVFPQLVAR